MPSLQSLASRLFIALALLSASAHASILANRHYGPFACHQGSPDTGGASDSCSSCTCNDGSTYPTLPGTESCGYTAVPTPTTVVIAVVDGVTITPTAMVNATTNTAVQPTITDIMSFGSGVIVLNNMTMVYNSSSISMPANTTSSVGVLLNSSSPAISTSTTTQPFVTTSAKPNGAVAKLGPRLAVVVAFIGACLLYPSLS